ncbi:hypothetical protein HOLleu_12504 [Holothuria leucospilota]|uniref:Uncharacterized protein n=1 Tax=Holothuria leucospilota TaxID=206669 RepID=A0A9Q1CB15_HOLLE|nr:hypothetical protein HOLleu_12504 [Holothuria leucospilota]
MTYTNYSYVYIVCAVVALKIGLLIFWICRRANLAENRRRTIIVRQIHAPQQVPYENLGNSPASEWQGPYPQVAPAGVTVVTNPKMDQPPSYSESVSGVQGPKY